MTPLRCAARPAWCVFLIGAVALLTTSRATGQTIFNGLRGSTPAPSSSPNALRAATAPQATPTSTVPNTTAAPNASTVPTTTNVPTTLGLPLGAAPPAVPSATAAATPAPVTPPSFRSLNGRTLNGNAMRGTNTPAPPKPSTWVQRSGGAPTTGSATVIPASPSAVPPTATIQNRPPAAGLRSPPPVVPATAEGAATSQLRINGATMPPSPTSKIEIRGSTTQTEHPTTVNDLRATTPVAAPSATTTPATTTPATTPVTAMPDRSLVGDRYAAPATPTPTAAPSATANPSTLQVRTAPPQPGSPTWPIVPPSKPNVSVVDFAPKPAALNQAPAAAASTTPPIETPVPAADHPLGTLPPAPPLDAPHVAQPAPPQPTTMPQATAEPPAKPLGAAPNAAPVVAAPPAVPASVVAQPVAAPPVVPAPGGDPVVASPQTMPSVEAPFVPSAPTLTTTTKPPSTASLPAPPVPPTASIAAAPKSRVPAEILPVDFNGVTLGESTLHDVTTAWGPPLEKTVEQGTTRCRYAIEPFASVDVAFADGTALSIIVDLGQAFPPDDVRKELGIDDLVPVTVKDESGRTLGWVYPERGVSLRFDDAGGEPRVTFIGLDRIDARPFVLRAEQSSDRDWSAALADLDAALKLDAKSARAHWLQARILQDSGRRREALAAVEQALAQEPKGAEYLLTRAALLAEAGLFDAALADATAVIEGTTAAPHLQARAWCLRGDLCADGPARDYAQAMDAHTRAVRLAEAVVDDKRITVRRAAKDVLIDAHLGIAEDIAWGNWQGKADVVGKWLDKARRMADQWSADDEASPDARLAVRRRAAACCVGLQGEVDPKLWADELLAIRDELQSSTDDDLRRRHLQWECGLGLYDALQSYHARGNADAALECGEAVVQLLAAGRDARDERPTDAYMFGRLYFRIGSIYAVRKQDHALAVTWFERAAPLLERPLPEAVAADRGRQGETLVSMGVSYWAVGKRERAMELTNVGSRYMQTAVNDGTLTMDAMAVPYSNLASMHRQLGDDAAGKQYAEMASRAELTSGLQRR